MGYYKKTPWEKSRAGVTQRPLTEKEALFAAALMETDDPRQAARVAYPTSTNPSASAATALQQLKDKAAKAAEKVGLTVEAVAEAVARNLTAESEAVQLRAAELGMRWHGIGQQERGEGAKVQVNLVSGAGLDAFIAGENAMRLCENKEGVDSPPDGPQSPP